jgi:hypothetical protein
MEPLKWEAPWWPDRFGQLSTRGSQDGKKYAFFPDRYRLLIERNGKLMTYDSVGHRIHGVSRQTSHRHTLAFTSPGRDRPVRNAVELHYKPADGWPE